MTEILDYIGYHGPLIHIIITFCLLWNFKTYLFVYLIGIIINHWIIILLKDAIAEHRPDGWRKIPYIDSEILEKGALVYGMPSGHSQTLFYSIAFLYLVKRKFYIILFSFVLAVLTWYQRWKYKRHSLKQLFVGAVIGGLFGTGMYYFTNRLLTNCE